jgi:hypothetical protein
MACVDLQKSTMASNRLQGRSYVCKREKAIINNSFKSPFRDEFHIPKNKKNKKEKMIRVVQWL